MRRRLGAASARIRRLLASSKAERPLALVLATVVVLLAACGPKTEVVYVNREELADGAYRPFARSRSPLVHSDGRHEPAEEVAIGPAPAEQPAPYTAFAARRDPRVHPSGAPHVVAKVALAHERSESGSASASHGAASIASGHGTPTSSPVAIAGGPIASASTGSSLVSDHRASAGLSSPVAQPAVSPTVPARLHLGPSLGAVADAPGTSATAATGSLAHTTLALVADDEELATVAGRIESLDGPLMTVQTEAGLSNVRVSERARLERDMPGTEADLKPGQFVGVLHTPGGPATSIRLYATGPSMPAPGVVPMVGSRVGQVTTFGSIVGLQFGGLLLNAGGQTTAVTLPNGVEILRPAPADPAVLGVGAQVIAMGPQTAESTVDATAVRVTGAARPGR